MVIDYSVQSAHMQWIEAGEAFFLNGVMYDVAQKKISNGTLYLYCITENKETEIINDLSLKISNAADSGKDLKLAFTDIFVVASPENLAALPVFKDLFNLTLHHGHMVAPPPRFIDYTT